MHAWFSTGQHDAPVNPVAPKTTRSYFRDAMLTPIQSCAQNFVQVCVFLKDKCMSWSSQYMLDAREGNQGLPKTTLETGKHAACEEHVITTHILSPSGALEVVSQIEVLL